MWRKLVRFSSALVAGGAGFIGSHIAERLLEEGNEVTVLDNLYAGCLENLRHCKRDRRFNFVKGDVRNFDLVNRLVKNVEIVFNEAAIVSVPRSLENPILTNEVNVGGTLNLLKACLNSDVKRFIQASSASVYGNTEELPITEDRPTNPISPYAVAELAAENYAKVFCQQYGLETICLRYFNVYGPRQICSAYSGVTTILLNQISRNQPPIIFGDGRQTRDFVYVEDIVEANMLALSAKKAAGQVFNVATGTPNTINSLVAYIKARLGKQPLEAVHKPPRAGDIRHSYASIEKASRILQYEPRFSLREGIAKLVSWHQSSKTNRAIAHARG